MSVATTAAIATPAAHAHAGGGLRSATRVFNRVVLRLAGTPFLPLYGVIEHQGRRTGKAFRTPVVVRPTDDGFVVPMPWGEGTDWYRNVRAAGGCVIRWKGRDYPLGRPVVIADPEEVRRYFSRFQGAMMGRLGISQCLRLRHRSKGR